jgi:hypothetical protein
MATGWGRPFEDPIKLDGRKLVTLRDAGEYIAALPKREQDKPEWRAAMVAPKLRSNRRIDNHRRPNISHPG